MINKVNFSKEINLIISGNSNGKPLLFLPNKNSVNYNEFSDFKIIEIDRYKELKSNDVCDALNILSRDSISVVGFNEECFNILYLLEKVDIDKCYFIFENFDFNEFLFDKDKLILENTKNGFKCDLNRINDKNARIVFINNCECELLNNINSCLKNSYIKNSNNYKEVIELEEKVSILYEDNHVLVVNKPSGLLSQKEKDNEFDILDLYKNYLKVRDNKPGNVYLGLVQRLDRNVSGIMVLSKTSKAHERLNQNRPKKKYMALVKGILNNKEDTLINFISKDLKEHKAIESKDGKKAILNYKVINETDKYSVLDIEIETGRFHQIRYQLSFINHPIVNDSKYGVKDLESNEIKLVCYQCEFIHPTLKVNMKFEIKTNLFKDI